MQQEDEIISDSQTINDIDIDIVKEQGGNVIHCEDSTKKDEIICSNSEVDDMEVKNPIIKDGDAAVNCIGIKDLQNSENMDNKDKSVLNPSENQQNFNDQADQAAYLHFPNWIESFYVVKKLRRNQLVPTRASRLFILVQYISMAFGRAFALLAIISIDDKTSTCKYKNDYRDDDDGSISHKECHGYVIACVVLGICVSTISDASWIMSLLSFKLLSLEKIFPKFPLLTAIMNTFLLLELVYGLLSLHIWFYFFYPISLLIKGCLRICCIRMPKIWATLATMCVGSWMMNIIGSTITLLTQPVSRINVIFKVIFLGLSFFSVLFTWFKVLSRGEIVFWWRSSPTTVTLELQEMMRNIPKSIDKLPV